jgi:pyruvate dehydrogenase E2 component (dihydrolipoamide acetyltransferase)
MAYEFRFPDLGEGIAEAELRALYVKVGDEVAEHQVLAEVETDKAVAEIPSPKGGRVLSILGAEGDTLRVGAPFIVLALAGEAAAGDASGGAAPAPTARGGSVVGLLPEADDEAAEAGDVLAVPAVRALARERGVDLAGMRGSGPEGSVRLEDLGAGARAGARQDVGARPPAGADEFGPIEIRPLRGLRKSIARHLEAASAKAVWVSVFEEADATELWAIKDRQAEELARRGVRLTMLAFIVKAAARALSAHPSFNAAFDEEADAIALKKYVNIGIAADTEEGLLVPVLKSVEGKGIARIAAEIESLAGRARERKLEPSELRGSSFSITNFGHTGGSFATPVPNYPDVAILGCGRIADRPWVRDGALSIRKILPLSFSFDHRVNDGAEAGRFLTDFARLVEDPGLLLVDGA